MSFAGREEQEFLEKTRLAEQSPEWRNVYQERAGIEGTISQLVRGYGLRQTRYIGKEKTHLHIHRIRLIRLGVEHLDKRVAQRGVTAVVRPFIEKSLSEETRRAYGRVIKEFFAFHRNIEPTEIKPIDVIRWRDSLIANKKSAATVSFKLSVVRSLFEYLKAGGFVSNNPALSKFVTPPKLSEDLRGRALTVKEVNYILAGPDRENPEGARDYAILLTLLRTSLRVAEVCSLKSSSVKWSHGRWTLKYKIKGGRERTIPLPTDVKKAIDEYLRLDRDRRTILKSGGGNESWIFQPISNYRTLVFDKPLSTTMVWYIVRKWGEFSGIGKVSPHDLRRTAITRALDKGLTYRQVQIMSRANAS